MVLFGLHTVTGALICRLPQKAQNTRLASSMKCDQRYHKKAEEEKRKPHSSKADDKKSKKERKEKKNEKKEKVLFFVRFEGCSRRLGGDLAHTNGPPEERNSRQKKINKMK